MIKLRNIETGKLYQSNMSINMSGATLHDIENNEDIVVSKKDIRMLYEPVGNIIK